MRNFTEKKKKWIAWVLGISFVTGMIFSPLSALDVQAGGGSTHRNTAKMAASLPASPPAVTVSPSPVPTAHPVLAQNPNASILLGSNTEQAVIIYLGDKGLFDIDRSNTVEFPVDSISSLTRLEYHSSNQQVIQTESEGTYQAVGIGRAFITVNGYNDNSEYGDGRLFERSYEVVVYPDMKNVTLQKTSLTIYKADFYYTNDDESVSVKLNSKYVLDEGNEEIDISLSSSNRKMHVNYRLADNVLTLSCGTTGTTTLTVMINGKEFTVRLRVVSVKMSSTSLLMTRRRTKSLRVKGFSGKIKWKSSNKKVVSINSKGKMKTKKEGNAIITAQFEGCKLGCVVSVTTPRKKGAITLARRIARTSKYSQPRRMQKGFYDCSSLVWRAYAPFGYKFGAGGNAPVAADEARWLAGRNQLLQGGYSRSNVEKLKIRAGDLLFKTGAKNGRYMGIYHVEMIAGYEFYGFDENGKPVVVSKWANRPDGYYEYGCGIVGRL